jgi:hypothetical protein
MAHDKQVTIDGGADNWAGLFEQARTQLAHLRATDQEIQRLRTRLSIAQTAERSHIPAIKAELPDHSSDGT